MNKHLLMALRLSVGCIVTLGALMAGSAHAQGGGDVGADTVRVRYFSPSIPASEALVRLQRESPGQNTPWLFAQVAASGDSAAYFAAVERLALESSRRGAGHQGTTYAALRALRVLGAPRSYFRWRALDALRNPVLAGAAVMVLAEDPEQEEASAIGHLSGVLFDRSVPGFGEAASEYMANLRTARDYAALATSRERADFLLRTLTSGGSGPLRRWAESHLRALYAEDPAGVDAAIGSFDPTPTGFPPPPIGHEFPPPESVRALLWEVARAPGTLVPPPSLTAQSPPRRVTADLHPILECVGEGGDGRLTAYFGYENRGGRSVSVDRGERNRVTPAAYHGLQPVVFDGPEVIPGHMASTPPYPAYAWRVTFQPAERVEWRLGNEVVTASADSPRCPQP